MINNLTKSTIIAEKPYLAKSMLSRMRGMLGRKFRDENDSKNNSDFDALIFEKNNSIHMFFMSYAIDVLYLDKENKVVGLKHGIRPWRLSACSKAKTTIELPEGYLKKSKTGINDQIEYKPTKTI